MPEAMLLDKLVHHFGVDQACKQPPCSFPDMICMTEIVICKDVEAVLNRRKRINACRRQEARSTLMTCHKNMTPRAGRADRARCSTP